MNTKKAIKILKEKGYFVEQISKNKFRVSKSRRETEYDDYLDGHELVRLAKIWTSEGQNLPFKENVKHFDKRRNRQKTNQAIHHEEFDKFPKGKIYKEDIWSWD
jgi:hypothetical protein